MKKIVKLTENDVRNIVMKSVQKILQERKRPTKLDISEYLPQDDGMSDVPPMGDPMAGGMPPMDNGGQDPMMGGDDPNAMGGDPMAGGDPNAMGEDEEPMDEPTGGSGDSELDDILNQLDDNKKDAVKKYAKSMLNDNDNDGIDDNAESADNGDDPMAGGDPNAMGGDPMQQMQESFMREMNIAMMDRQEKRGNKKISNYKRSPWIFK